MTIEQVYEKGDEVEMLAFFDDGGNPPVPADPLEVDFALFVPRTSAPITFVYGIGVEVVKDAVGAYRVRQVVTTDGEYEYQFHGSGNGVTRTVTDTFRVKKTAF